MNLGALDLNLLRVLVALDDARSVSEAARALGLSQSATSHALSRLREVLEDELFVRVGRGMVPTPRAEALAAEVRPALARIGAALGTPQRFDPRSARATLRIAAVDLGQVLLLPDLALRLTAEAPEVQLVVGPMPRDPRRALIAGEIDLALGGVEIAPELRQISLGVDPFTCVVRRDHPCRDALSVEAFAELGHVLVTPRMIARGHVDDALAAVGRTRKVAYVTPQLGSAARVVARSDLVLTTASRMAQIAAQTLPLVLVPPPLPIEPYVLAATWHPRRDPDELLGWVRGVLAALAQELLDPLPAAQ